MNDTTESNDLQKPSAFTIKKGRPDGFKFTITVDGKSELVKFTNNLYKCPTAEHEAAIDALMHKPAFTQNIVKVDLDAGQAIAKAHMEGMHNIAQKGGASAESMKAAENAVIREQVNESAEALASEDLMVTHDVDQSENRVIADALADDVPDVPKTAPAVKLNLTGKG